MVHLEVRDAKGVGASRDSERFHARDRSVHCLLQRRRGGTAAGNAARGRARCLHCRLDRLHATQCRDTDNRRALPEPRNQLMHHLKLERSDARRRGRGERRAELRRPAWRDDAAAPQRHAAFGVADGAHVARSRARGAPQKHGTKTEDRSRSFEQLQVERNTCLLPWLEHRTRKLGGRWPARSRRPGTTLRWRTRSSRSATMTWPRQRCSWSSGSGCGRCGRGRVRVHVCDRAAARARSPFCEVYFVCVCVFVFL